MKSFWPMLNGVINSNTFHVTDWKGLSIGEMRGHQAHENNNKLNAVWYR